MCLYALNQTIYESLWHYLLFVGKKTCAFDRRDGVVVRAFAVLRFIPLVESFQKTLKMVSTVFLLGARHSKDVVENKLANSLVVFVGKTKGC